MDRREKEKIIAVLEIVKASVEHHLDKTRDDAQAQERYQFLRGEYEAYGSVLRFLQTGRIAYLTTWCDMQQKRMIDDIVNNRIKV